MSSIVPSTAGLAGELPGAPRGSGREPQPAGGAAGGAGAVHRAAADECHGQPSGRRPAAARPPVVAVPPGP